MGFADRWTSAFGMGPVDYAEAIAEQLTSGDEVIAHAQVIPSAYEGSSTSLNPGNRLLGMAINAVWNKASKQKHVGGEAGSIAQGLPREGELAVAAFTRTGLSLWNFGTYGSEVEGKHVLTIPRADVASVEDTGQRAQGGVPVARVTFADGSFFDYRLISKPGDEFWRALTAW